MLEPKKIKYRKVHRGNRKGMAKGGTEVNFGSYGMKAMAVSYTHLPLPTTPYV